MSGVVGQVRLSAKPVYKRGQEISMHADTGCPAIAYPRDVIETFAP